MLFKIFFWISNLCFLLIAYVGILPYLGSSFFPDLLAGELPFDLFLPFVGLICVPTASTVSRTISNLNKKSARKIDVTDFSLRTEFIKEEIEELQLLPKSEVRGAELVEGSSSPARQYKAGTLLSAIFFGSKGSDSLAKLFFGVEAPLMLLCLLRLFWLHELTPATTLILLTALTCVVSFTYGALQPGKSQTGMRLTWLQMAGHSLMLLLGVYVGVLYLFYALPAIYVGGLGFVYGLFFPPILPLSIALIALLIMPLGLAIAYIQAWRGFHRTFAAARGKFLARATTVGVVGVWFIIFAVVQIQPQDRVFALLNQPVGDASKRQELLQKSSFIREGLLNAYLARYRYPTIRDEDRAIRDFYSFMRFPTKLADGLQDAYNFVVSPFIYNGSVKDSIEAETLYAQFFDRPILKAEQRAVLSAVNATFDRTSAKAGLLSVNQKKVLLAQQDISIRENGDWADVELHEVYVNKTPDRQEILYAFSLPESAVLTGVWLGDTDKKSASFPFAVSPRGAAQRVYNAEVQKRVDPALLEQVGPRNYRLRVFPILPNFARDSSGKQLVMHMWMTYKVMGQLIGTDKSQGWMLPQLSERRNVYWNKDTKRTVNGKSAGSFQEDAAWLDLYLQATQAMQLQEHKVSLLSSDLNSQIVAKPLAAADYHLPKGKRFAIVLDSSRSMASHRESLTSNLRWLEERVAKDNDIDLYISTAAGAKPQRIDNLKDFKLSEGTFYGLLRPQEILQQFAQLRRDTAYDAVLVMTDEGNYELTDEKASVPNLTSPLWMVHLGGLPAAYDDATLDAIQHSGGGVATLVSEVIERIATQAALGSVVNVVDGYAWSWNRDNSSNGLTESTAKLGNSSKNDFLPLAARQVVRELSQGNDKTQLVELDRIHALAKRYNIVTPYSSMIVLVNDEQREALKQAESQSDRFNRTVEDNQLPQPTNSVGLPSVSGVPEPQEWLLLGVVSIALLAIAWQSNLRQDFASMWRLMMAGRQD